MNNKEYDELKGFTEEFLIKKIIHDRKMSKLDREKADESKLNLLNKLLELNERYSNLLDKHIDLQDKYIGLTHDRTKTT